MSCVSAIFPVPTRQIYVQVNKEAQRNDQVQHAAGEFFRKLEQRDSKAMSLWQQFREISVKEYQQVYEVNDQQAQS